MIRACATRAARTIALALLALLGLSSGLVIGTGAASAAPTAVGQTPTAGDGSAAYDDLAGCVANTGRLLVVLLVDESGSLQQTDPKAVRVAAAKTALAGLSGLTTSGAGGAAVDVLVSAFSNTFKPVGAWSPLTAASLPGLQQTVDGLAARNTGMDTDFINALAGAREALAEQAVTLGAQAQVCKAILLFTDGRYDIGVRTNDAQLKKYGDSKPYAPGVLLTDEAAVAGVEKTGVEALCKDGGVADQVRGDDIVTLTIALTAKLRPADQDFLQAVTLGKGGDQSCGSRDGAGLGVFLPASDLESLIGTFDAVATRVAGGRPIGTTNELTACPEKDCDEGTTKIAIDGSVRRVHLFVKVPSTKARIELRAPGIDDTLSLSTRSASAPPFKGGKVQIAWPSPKAATIDIDPLPTAAGTWTVTVIDPGATKDSKASVLVYFFTDVVARLTTKTAVTVGEPIDLEAEVISKGGKVAADLRSAEIVADVTDPVTGKVDQVTLTSAGKTYKGTYTPPADMTSSVVRIVLHLSGETQDGVTVSSLSPEVSLPTRKPAGYPFVGPPELTLPPVTGKETAAGTLQVFRTGAGLKPGCVWIGDVTVAAKPERVGAVDLSVDGAGRTAAKCVKSPTAGSTTLTLTFAPDQRASGSVRGSVRVWSQKDGDKPLPTDIPFSFEMTRGVDKTKQIAVFFGLLAAGLALPVALLFIMNYLSTRFQAMQYVQAANVPVIIRRSGEVLRHTKAGHLNQINLYGDDFAAIEASDNPRKFSYAGLDFVARPPVNPFAEGYAVASPSGKNANVAREGRKVTLSMSLAGSWMFLYDPDETDAATQRIIGAVGNEVPPEIHGRLVAFIARGPVPPQAGRLVEDIHAKLPSTAQRLAELARAARKG